jgi:hypothetical protein
MYLRTGTALAMHFHQDMMFSIRKHFRVQPHPYSQKLKYIVYCYYRSLKISLLKTKEL